MEEWHGVRHQGEEEVGNELFHPTTTFTSGSHERFNAKFNTCNKDFIAIFLSMLSPKEMAKMIMLECCKKRIKTKWIDDLIISNYW